MTNKKSTAETRGPLEQAHGGPNVVADGIYQDDFTKLHLRLLEARYRATANPLWAWAALQWCIGEVPRTPIPEWCIAYFVDAARRLTQLAPTDYSEERGGKGRSYAAKAPKLREITNALRLTRKGGSAYRDAWSTSRSARAAEKYYMLRAAKWPAKDALNEVMEWLGAPDEDQAKKIIREGKRVLGVKT